MYAQIQMNISKLFQISNLCHFSEGQKRCDLCLHLDKTKGCLDLISHLGRRGDTAKETAGC